MGVHAYCLETMAAGATFGMLMPDQRMLITSLSLSIEGAVNSFPALLHDLHPLPSERLTRIGMHAAGLYLSKHASRS